MGASNLEADMVLGAGGAQGDGAAIDGHLLPLPFRVDVWPDGERVLVCPAGETDLATAGQVEQTLVEVLDQGFAHIVVDLGAVSFMDSTAICLLVASDRRARNAGARLSLILGAAGSSRALEIAGVFDHLEVIGR
jgi:anti-sigma B factor antagonist